MPFLKLSTNVTIDQTQSEQLLSELSQATRQRNR